MVEVEQAEREQRADVVQGLRLSSNPGACGGSWTTGTGNNPPVPAAPLPAYMGVIVASSATTSGSAITGNIVHVVVVKTSAGYDADPKNAGTGTVTATVC